MIHLSRFLIGIRHNRIFRIKSLSGQLVDTLFKSFSDKFDKVTESRSNEEFILSNSKDNLFTRINRDDIILEEIKLWDWETRLYIEINKEELINITEKIIPIVSEALLLKDDFIRIGMIFEFRIPKWETMNDSKFGSFIYNNFIKFETDGEKDQGQIRFAYKLKAPGGGAIAKLEDYRNVIIRIEESTGINENGKEENCLFISADLQHIFKPSQKNINVRDHYNFASEHLISVILPKLKSIGVDITL